MSNSDVLTGADIARLAGVTRATVSNWRRRHADFPAPVGGTAASPGYARADVESWLANRGALPEYPLEDRIWRSIRSGATDDEALADMALKTAGFLMEAKSFPMPDFVWPEALREVNQITSAPVRKQILEALVRRYAETKGAQAAATPEPVATLMAALAGPGRGDTVLDPAVGTGSLLFSARKYRVSRLFGQDLDITPALLAAHRFSAEASEPDCDETEISLRAGSSLRDDQFADLLADVVLCHPPFGVQDWGLDELAEDNRWRYGTPPRSEGELAWVQHALAHLREGGKAVVLMPPAAASRPSGRRIRAELVRHGALRAVVSLPPGAVEPRHIPVHIWVLEHPGSQVSRDPHVLLLDAGHLGTSWPSGTEELAGIWAILRDGGDNDPAADEKPGFWKTIPAVDLLGESVDLTPTRHIGAVTHAWSPEQTTAELNLYRTGLRKGVSKLSSYQIRDDWEFLEQIPRWRMTDIAELGQWKAVVFHRASAAAPEDGESDVNLGKPKGHPVLRAVDVENGEPPSGTVPEKSVLPGWVMIKQDDVIVPAVAADRIRARVARLEDGGAILGRGLHLIRPDLDRLDPWFLSGFLSSPASVQQASTGTTGTRIDVRRLAVPVIPLDQQQQYGSEFRELHDLEVTSRDLTMLTARISQLLGDNLTAGRLKLRRETSETVQNSSHDPRSDDEE